MMQKNTIIHMEIVLFLIQVVKPMVIYIFVQRVILLHPEQSIRQLGIKCL